MSYPSPENQHQVVDKCLRERKAREKVNGTKMGRDGFHPRGLCSLIGEVGPRAVQHFACRVVINALRVTKARARSQWVVERVLARATLRLEAGGAWRGRRKVKCFQHMLWSGQKGPDPKIVLSLFFLGPFPTLPCPGFLVENSHQHSR